MSIVLCIYVVPDIPSIKKTVPVYFNDSKELKRLLITISIEVSSREITQILSKKTSQLIVYTLTMNIKEIYGLRMIV